MGAVATDGEIFEIGEKRFINFVLFYPDDYNWLKSECSECQQKCRVSQRVWSTGGGGGGSNLGKMAKNCMKITKLAFLGQNSGSET